MKKLLSIEWIKLRKYKAFWILLILFAFACVGIYAFIYNIQSKITLRSGGHIKFGLFDSQHLWHTTAWLNNLVLILPGLLMIVLLANEISYKTLRQQIINGISRTQAIVSKWLLLLIIAIICWVIYFVIVFIMGDFILKTSPLFTNFYYAGYGFINIILSLSVAFILSLWLKRSGLTIALYLVYSLFFENILGYFFDKITNHLGNFLPLSSGASLTPSPLSKFLGGAAGAPATYWYVLTAIVWISLFFIISLRYIRRADL